MATEQDGFIIPDNVLEIRRELDEKRKSKEPKPKEPGVMARAGRALADAVAPREGGERSRGGVRGEAKPYVAGDERIKPPEQKPAADPATATVFDRVDQAAIAARNAEAPLTDDAMAAGSVAPWKAEQDAAANRYRSASGAPSARPTNPNANLSGQAGAAVADATGSQRLGSLAEGVADTAMLGTEALATTAKLGVDIANLATIGAAQPVSDWLGQTIGAIQGAKSDRYQAKRAEFAGLMQNPDAGVMDVVAFMAANPRYAAEIGVPSVPSMLLGATGARIGAALVAARGGSAATGAKVGAGAANVAMNAGATFSDTQGDLGQKLAAAGAASAGTALLGRLGGAETALATGTAGGSARALLNTGVREWGQEGGESLSQSLGQGTAEGNFDLGEAAKGAMTEGLIGGVIGAGAGAAAGQGQPATQKSAEQLARDKGFLRPAQARAETLNRLDDLAAVRGLPASIVEKLKKAADGKPLAELSGWMKRAIGNLAQAGAITPIDPADLSLLDEQPDTPPKGQAPTAPNDGKAETPAPGQREAAPNVASAADDFSGLDSPAQPQGDRTAPVQPPTQPEPTTEALTAQGDEPQAPPPVEGPKINRNWTAFAPESGTLSIPRAQMPQIKAEHRGALVNFLRGQGVTSEADEIPAADLKPTQGEFSPQKVQRAATYTGGDRSILVSSDGYVLDGHHQWLAKREAGQPVKAIRLGAPIQDLMRLAHQFPSSFTAKGGPRADAGNGSARVDGIGNSGPAVAGDDRGTGSLVSGDQGAGPGGAAAAPVRPSGERDDAGAAGSQQGNDALKQMDAAMSDLAALFAESEPGAPQESAPSTTGGNDDLSTEAGQRGGSTKVRPAGPPTETFAGIHGEGMAEHIAKVKLREFTRTRPDLEWSIADAEGNPKYKAGRYVVEGRKAPSQAADGTPAKTAGAAGEDAGQAAGVPGATATATTEAAGVKPGKKPKAFKHPDKVRGSLALAEISRALGGISTDLLPDLSHKVSRTRTNKFGKQTRYTAWDNPMVTGVGPLFRAGGTSDLTELARVLEEFGYITANTLERDYGEARNLAQDIIKAELNEGGSSDRIGDHDAMQAKVDARAQREAEDAELADPWADYIDPPDDMELAGASGYDAETQEAIARLATEAEALGIDVDTLREKFFDSSNPEWTQSEYDQELAAAIREAISAARRTAETDEPGADREGGQGGGQTDSDPAGAGSDRPDRPDQAVRSEGETEGLTLTAETEADAKAKADREAQALASEKAAKEVEQARLKREADAKEAKARADQTVDDFQLGQSAERQLSGQQDIFSEPAPADDEKPTGRATSTRMEPGDSDAMRQAKADAMKALGDLGDLMGRSTKLNMMPEQEQKLLPVLTRLFDAALRMGYVKFKEASKFVLDQIRNALGDEIADQITIDHLQGAYITMAGSHKDAGVSTKREVVEVEDKAEIEAFQPEADNAPTEAPNVPSATVDLERDRRDSGTDQPALAPVLFSEPGGPVWVDGAPAVETGSQRGRRTSDSRVPDRGATAGREPGNQPSRSGDGADQPTLFDAGSSDGERGDDPGFDGVPPETVAASAVAGTAEGALGGHARVKAQREALAIAVKVGDAQNIEATLPYLLPGQREDVLKTETRFSKPDGFGMLLTNGTGTGKTFSGLGVIRRYVSQGRKDILIVVPDNKIAADWIESGVPLGLAIRQLDDTKTAGKGVVITTYSNLGQNDELARRRWDLVVSDEAHMLMQAQDGRETLGIDSLRAISGHPRGIYTLHTMLNREDIDKLAAMVEQVKTNDTAISAEDTTDVRRAALQAENTRLEKLIGTLSADLTDRRKELAAEIMANQGLGRTRVLALSATPFAYDKTIDWAEGYLFDYAEGYPHDETSRGYNVPDPHDYFFITHLGWSMRVNKLTEPDAKVDRGVMQRQFNTWLKTRGSLSTRVLDVDADYDRRFVLVDSAVGNQIDQALAYISNQSRETYARLKEQKSDDANGWSILQDQMRERFYGKQGHLVRRYLLEAIKAKEVVRHVREHMAMGRKVVVFHDFKKGGSVNPFNFDELPDIEVDEDAADADRMTAEMQAARRAAFNAAAREFAEKFPDLAGGALLQDLISPLQRFAQEFPDALLINGDQKEKDLLARYKRFNDDSTGPLVALVQAAKDKGWSGHDTTGKNQRVLFNLGLPTQPTKTTQQEGRIYRTGQVTNAIMRYLNTGTDWERWAFASTIAERAGAAENLGMGEEARALKDSFIAAFEASGDFPAGHEGEGTGGKAADRLAQQSISEWDRAKTFYFGQQKKNSRTKAQEGEDYFATPEPIGLKMVEWANGRGGEDALEPSGGHGAIARWLPENMNRTAIEPESGLGSRMAMVFNGKIIQDTFENLHVSNKFDVIAMNPPFGTAGRKAIDHLAKAATHLRDGGRIVALINDGPSVNAKFDKWFYEENTKPIKPLMELDIGMGPEPIYRGDTIKSVVSWQSGVVTGKTDSGFIKVKAPGQPGETLVAEKNVAGIARTGPRTETFKPADGLHLVAEIKLPGVTFGRAGTGVRTRIVVIDRIGKDGEALQGPRIDLTGIDDINELFDRLEYMDVPKRTKPVAVDVPEVAARGPVVLGELEELAAAADDKAMPSMRLAVDEMKAGRPNAAGRQVSDAVRMSESTAFQTQGKKMARRLAAMRVTGGAAKPVTRDAEREQAAAAGAAVAGQAGLEIVEHTTQKGKVLRGYIAKHMTKAQAQEVSPYTWAKDGGYFIRQEHIEAMLAKYPPPGLANLSRRAAAGGGLDVDVLTDWAAKAAAAWTGGPSVKVVASVAGLPPTQQAQLRSMGADDTVRALVLPESAQVYLIADRMATMDEAQFALFHEVYGHFGLRKLLGGYYATTMTRLSLANPALRAEARAWMLANGAGEIAVRVERGMSPDEADREVRLLSIEEALADRAGNAEELTGWARFMAALQAGLRRLGLNAVADILEGMSQAETLALLDGARRAVQGAAADGQRAGDDAPVFSRGTTGAMPETNAPGPSGDAQQGAKQGNAVAINLPQEMVDRGVMMFDGLRTIGGHKIAQSFLDTFNAFPKVNQHDPMLAMMGIPSEPFNVPYRDRFENAFWSLPHQRLIAQELEKYRDGEAITPAKALFIADLMQMESAVPGLKEKIYLLMPDSFKNDDAAQEDFGTVSQANSFDPMRAYNESYLETRVRGADPIADRKYIDEELDGDAKTKSIKITSTDIAERFLKDPTKLIRLLVEITGFVRDSNEASWSALVENYAPELMQKEREKEAKRLTDYLLANAALGKPKNDQQAPVSGGALEQSARDPTGTEAFRAWFGDSKVVDAEGNPLVVYHGTNADFSKFSDRKLGENTDWNASSEPYAQTSRVGFWFNSRPMAGKNSSAGYALDMPVYLSIKNPKREMSLDWLAQGLESMKGRTYRKRLIEAGYDGIVLRDEEFGGTSYIAFRPEQIKSATGNSGAFDPAEPSILLSRKPKHTPEQAEALARAGIRPGGGLVAGVRNGWAQATGMLKARGELAHHFQQGALDQFHGIKRIVEESLGGLPVDQDPYIAARLANGGASSVMRGLLLHGQARWAANGQHLEKIDGTTGLLDILAPLGEDLNDWFGWMVGNRAARLMAEGRENNLTADQIKALQSLATPEKIAAFRVASVQYAAFKRSVLDVAQGAGLIDPESRKVWDHADYIPFYREIDRTGAMTATGKKGLAGQSSGIRVLKGGEAALNDPMENVLMNFSRLIDASLKNNAIRKTVDAMNGTGWVEKVGYAMSSQIIPREQVRKLLIAAGTDEAVLDVIPEEAFDGMAKMWAIQAPNDPDVVRVMRGGRPEFYRVNDPLMLKALTSFVPFDFPGLSVARFAKRLLTRAVTITPEFMMRNYIRDSIATRMIAKDGVPIGGGLRGIAKSFRESGAFEDMLFAGASFQSGNVNAGDPERTGLEVRKALRRRGMSAASIDGFMATVLDTPAKMLEQYERIGSAVENASREAVYEAAQRAGKNATAAAFEAKDLMDFSLRGSSAMYQLMADVLPFFNARVQGLYRLGRVDPKRLTAYASAMVLASTLLAMLNAGDDRYEELPDWDKDTYWHFWLAGGHFRIPKPFELGAIFGTIPERIVRAINGEDSTGKTAKRIAAVVAEQLAMDPVPQLLRPGLNVYANWDNFRDSPIENMSDEGKLPAQRYSPRTSDTARVAVGAVEPLANKVGLSPKRLEYLIGGYLGTTGMYALGLSDMVVRLAEDKPATPAWRADDIPVVRVFYRVDPARATVYESDLYAMRAELEDIMGSYRALVREGDREQATKFYAENRDKLQARGPVAQAAKTLSAYRKQADAIYSDPSLTPAEKRDRIDELLAKKNAAAKRVMQAQAVKALQ